MNPSSPPASKRKEPSSSHHSALHLSGPLARSPGSATSPGNGLSQVTRHSHIELSLPHFEPGREIVPGLQYLDELGRGGMGVVYKVRQVSLNRIVALKMLLHAQFTSSEQQIRFRLEGELSARVRHANIVQTYEVGTHAGCPFLVQEYVEGGTLARKLHDHHLPPREAADLVAVLARAMHAAHQCGIVHRDLKPGNILLSADGTPKISDFGLARILASDAHLTETGIAVGTPNYMAPEQALGLSDEYGPTTDVYALGVILYEALSGRLPFTGGLTQLVMEQIIQAEPPPLRRAFPQVPADLECICLKAMAKEPARRYGSAEALANDLEQYLEGRPIAARPVGRAERLWKWTRRFPARAALLAVVGLLILVVLPLITWLYITAEQALERKAQAEATARLEAQRARQEGARAKVEAGNAEAVTDFLNKYLLQAARPLGIRGGLGHDVSLRKALEHATEEVEKAFASRPLVEAKIRYILAITYLFLSEQERSEACMRRAYELRKAELGPDHADTLAAHRVLGRILFDQKNYEGALAIHRQCYEIGRRVFGAAHAETEGDLENIAACLLDLNRFSEAEPILEGRAKALAEATRTGPIRSEILPRLIGSLHRFAIANDKQGRFAESEKQYRQELELCKQGVGDGQYETLIVEHCLATSILNQRRPAEAAVIFEKCLAGKRQLLGQDHLETLVTQNNLGGAYFMMQRISDAEKQWRQCLEGRLKRLKADHTDVMESRFNLARALMEQRRFAEAEPLVEGNVQAACRRYAPDSVEALLQLLLQARFYERQFRYADGEPNRRRVIEGFRKIYGADHNRVFTQQYELAVNLYFQGKVAEAVDILSEVYHQECRRFGQDNPEVMVTANTLGGLLVELGRTAEAEPLVRHTWAHWRQKQEMRVVDRMEPQIHLGQILMRQGKLQESEQELLQALAALDGLKRPHLTLIYALTALGECRLKQRQFGEAERHLRQAWEVHKLMDYPPPSLTSRILGMMTEVSSAQGKAAGTETWMLLARPKPPAR